ncbi:IncF plasmid conjugative transfer protein TraD [Vibrio vulnificus]|uniref:type IV secretion system DNA-binding domain-containing protein n=1 Tax=Vibrio vulnificus TaxID=672 RepID=UPI000A2048CA|nr:type IV secretion system DNA-binding domain-containing protein [Vibrio vulnificus]ARN64658.1 IncF plasmid conjugative transfer protein TraD [Vibrio vulnificus]
MSLYNQLSTQRWGLIWGFTLFLGIASSLTSIYYTWSWFTPWEPLERHLPYLIDSALEGIVGQEQTWSIYSAYLNKNGWQLAFFCHLLIPIFASFILAGYLCMKLLHIPMDYKIEKHISGVQKLSNKKAYHHAKRKLKDDLKKCKSSLGLYLHPKVQISKKTEVGNILITGQPGSGKTVVILSILNQLVKRNIRLFIYDEKREYTSKYYNDESCILLAPWDERSQVWDISKDLENEAAPAIFAKHIISETREPIWCQSARLIFTGIIISLKSSKMPWGWAELYQTMHLNERELRKTLVKHYPQAVTFVEENNRTTQSIMITLQSDLAWIEWLALAWPKSHNGNFAITDWITKKDAKPHVIIQAHKQYAVVGSPMCHILMSLMVDTYLSVPHKQPCFLVLDELANLPKSKSLIKWLELARDKGGRTIAGTQAISQLHSLYGEHDTDTLTSMFSNLITLKVGATGGTAKYMSNALGERTIEQPQHQTDNRGQKSVTWQQVTLPTVQASEISQLPLPNKKGITGFLSISSWGATYQLLWPYPVTSRTAERSRLAKWAKKGRKPTTKPSVLNYRQNVKQAPTVPNRIIDRRREAKNVNHSSNY